MQIAALEPGPVTPYPFEGWGEPCSEKTMKPLALALLAITVLTGCAGASSTPPTGPSSAAVTGQVVWRERIMLAAP